MLRPPHIQESHWKEWVRSSAVDPLLTSCCVISLEGLAVYARLFVSEELPRRNGGRVSDTVYKKYFPLENGGWWCSGVDVLDNFTAELWGQFKPDTPRTSLESRGFELPPKIKQVKYEPPPKLPTSIYALPVPLHLQKAISLRHGVPLPENIVVTPQGRALGFWAWVIAQTQIPVIITEGAKKAGAIITAEYVAIALPGIYNGYRQPKDESGQKNGSPYLIPQLKVFAQKEREIIFCFDRDTNPQTTKNVRCAIAKTGKLLEREGCKVSVITWNYPFKGVDDLIANRGRDCFEQLYQERKTLANFNQHQAHLDLAKYNPLYVNQRYLSHNLVPPAEAQLIGLKSFKGSGKTQWLAELAQDSIRSGQRVMILCHREQLAIALAQRFGVDYRTEVKTSITKGLLGYALCIDSLHAHANPAFNPDEWQEALVIIDEAEQVFWHMLNSNTCQDHRVKIIESFKQLLLTAVGTGGKIYLADADLSSIALDYVRSLIGLRVKTWVVENKYNRPQKRKLITYSGHDPRELISALTTAIEQGQKPLVHTTGQKARSKWGSINLESYLSKLFPQHQILRIDSESVSEPGHRAYGSMDNLNEILPLYDIVICSPVVETGVSIDLKRHFDSVWAIAQGIQTVDAVCQTVERLRDGIPRHIWIKTTAKGNRIGNGSTNVKGLLASQHKLTQANISLLQQASISEFDELEVNFSPESLLAWAKRACLVNAGKNNYREAILSKLIEEGYEVSSNQLHNPEQEKIINEGLKQTRQENYQQYCQQVSHQDTPSPQELETLNNKRAKTQPERLKQRKGNLINRYGVEVTPELVEQDDQGWYSKLQLYYYLTVGNIYLAARDRHSLGKIKEQGQGKAFKPDINKRQLSVKVKTLQLINIEQFLDREAEFTAESLQDWLDFLIQFRFELKTILGVSIHPEQDSAIAVAQRILKKLGSKLKFKHQIRINGKPTRIYQGCDPNADGRAAIFNNWQSREQTFSAIAA